MDLGECDICHELKPIDAEGVCEHCRSSSALQNLDRPLRPDVPCGRCEHTTFVRTQKQVDGLGALEAYTCQKCGLTDLYVRGARDLPIGNEHGTDLVELGKLAAFKD